eukprot:CAMPEP_0168757212 /NCGR_PEP_ID=MMETSP0724-20121128/21050_1 /TAXON_ID=265536 /ORGANISM="Amphiprora sp., Strain CCMP467" /LENGTH=281 /DNA_ID=CAMNT_0008806015 /DNA_START=15 /DNA_END=860 /DNA_ORIENTATION=-
MGCAASTPVVEKAPPEPLPTLASLQAVELLEGEPPLTSGEDNFTSNDQVQQLIFRNIQQSSKGSTFQLETYEDALFHKLQIHPSKPGLGVKKRLEDLVHMHYEGQLEQPLAFCSKNPSKGLNYFLIMSPKPLREGQQPMKKLEGPTFCPNVYPYARVEFDLQEQIGKVHLVGERAGDPPLYTIHQCNPKVWVVKRQKIGPCAAMEQVHGIAKLTCYRVAFGAGTDPVLMSLFNVCIDMFLQAAKTQRWNFCPAAQRRNVQSVDWEPLDAATATKLFGRRGP